MWYNIGVKHKIISAVLLCLFSWNTLLGVAGGLLLHLHGDTHEHSVVHNDCSHHEPAQESKTCDLESKQDCCYENAHLFLVATEILDCRAGEVKQLPVFALWESSYDSVVRSYIHTSVEMRHRVSHSNSAHYLEWLKTVVLRV